MKGLELAERFYLEHGEPMLRREFSDILPLLAVGLAGSGSECLGFDDEISRDHDFEPGFCIFLPDEELIDRRTAFLLERAYRRLPKEFLGFSRSPLSPVGGTRHGVMRTAEFLLRHTGTEDGHLSLSAWLSLPEQSLAEATGGRIFSDPFGEISDARTRLAYLPEDVRLKKLAGNLLLMGQSGQYNYPRCISRGETAAAQLAMTEFAKSALHAIFLLNRRYLPYYKWSFRALRELPLLADEAPRLEWLISTGNDGTLAAEKQETVERLAQSILCEARVQGLTDGTDSTLEAHAYAVNQRIGDPELRNMHLLCGV